MTKIKRPRRLQIVLYIPVLLDKYTSSTYAFYTQCKTNIIKNPQTKCDFIQNHGFRIILKCTVTSYFTFSTRVKAPNQVTLRTISSKSVSNYDSLNNKKSNPFIDERTSTTSMPGNNRQKHSMIDQVGPKIIKLKSKLDKKKVCYSIGLFHIIFSPYLQALVQNFE